MPTTYATPVQFLILKAVKDDVGHCDELIGSAVLWPFQKPSWLTTILQRASSQIWSLHWAVVIPRAFRGRRDARQVGRPDGLTGTMVAASMLQWYQSAKTG